MIFCGCLREGERVKAAMSRSRVKGELALSAIEGEMGVSVSARADGGREVDVLVRKKRWPASESR